VPVTALTAHQLLKAVPASVTPDPGSLRVTVSGLLAADDDSATVTVSWSGGSAFATTTNGVADVTGIKAGVALTIAVTATNYSNTPDTGVAALHAGQLLRAAGATVSPDTGTVTVDVSGIVGEADITVFNDNTHVQIGGIHVTTGQSVVISGLPAGVPLKFDAEETGAGTSSGTTTIAALTAGQANGTAHITLA
jgi:hypothetical protein